MLILALDTALKSCSLALLDGEAVLASRRRPLEKGHAEELPPTAREAFAAAGVAPRELDLIAVVAGPGGFAGVRVGVAFARGLALGTKARTTGVSSLAALAAGARETPVAAAIDARRGQVYAALFGPAGEALLAPFVAEPTEARRRLVAAGGAGLSLVGDGGPLIDPQAGEFRILAGHDEIDPVEVARLGAKRFLADPSASPARPIYLRPPDAAPAKTTPRARRLGAAP